MDNKKAKLVLLERALETSKICSKAEIQPSARLFMHYVHAHKYLNKKKVLSIKKKEWYYTYKLFVRDVVEYNRQLGVKNSKVKFCYIIVNPAWPDKVKIGVSSQPHKRLAQYQTYSPLRDYRLLHWSPHNNATEIEKFIIEKYGDKVLNSGEWVDCHNIETLAKEVNSLAFTEELIQLFEKL